MVHRLFSRRTLHTTNNSGSGSLTGCLQTASYPLVSICNINTTIAKCLQRVLDIFDLLSTFLDLNFLNAVLEGRLDVNCNS